MKRERNAERRRMFSPQRMLALLRTRRAIEMSIEKEHRQPAPCSLALQRLKKERVALNDRIARLRNLHRAQLSTG